MRRPREAAAWPQTVPVRERMSSPVATVLPETSVREAVALMRARKVRHLPVVDAGGRLVGIVTDRDLRQVVFAPAVQERLRADAGAAGDVPVRDVMTWAVVSVRPGTELREAARVMHERKIGALPVVEAGRLVGILTESDALAALAEALRGALAPVRPLAGQPGGPYDYGFPEPGPGEVWQDEGDH